MLILQALGLYRKYLAYVAFFLFHQRINKPVWKTKNIDLSIYLSINVIIFKTLVWSTLSLNDINALK